VKGISSAARWSVRPTIARGEANHASGLVREHRRLEALGIGPDQALPFRAVDLLAQEVILQLEGRGRVRAQRAVGRDVPGRAVVDRVGAFPWREAH
jgi:hypothetical protein